MADSPPQPVPGEIQPEGEHHRRRHGSKGERLFDFLVYGPGNFIGIFALSAALAVVQKRHFPFVHEKLEDFLRARKLPESIVGAATPILLTSWGGTLMVPVLRWAENNKVYWSDKFNRMLGDPTPASEVAAAPQQTWGSLFAGRFTTMALVAPVMSALGGMFGPTMGRAEEKTGHAVARWMKVPTHADMPTHLIPQRDALKAAAGRRTMTDAARKELTQVTRLIEKHETVPFTFGKMLAVDAVVTVAAVVTMYVTSHLFARRNFEKHHTQTPEPQRRKPESEGSSHFGDRIGQEQRAQREQQEMQHGV